MTINKEGIETFRLKKVKNKHLNFTFKFKKSKSYRLKNPLRNQSALKRYNATTKNIQSIIERSVQKSERIRALGSKWSFTKVGFARDRIIDTKSLRIKFSLSNNHLHPSSKYKSEDLFLL